MKNLFKIILEATYFMFIVLIIFDILTNITYKLNFTNEILKINETTLFGLISINLGLINEFTKRFLGKELIK